jgi:hypothetical protein
MPFNRIESGFDLRENAPLNALKTDLRQPVELAPGTFKIVAPNREYNGVTMGVRFRDGIGYTTDVTVANRLTWDFHYESRNVTEIDVANAAFKLHQARVVSRAELALSKLEYGLDRAEATLGQGEAWLRGRVREIVELVPLRG